jgi:uncharacterized phage-associated protein
MDFITSLQAIHYLLKIAGPKDKLSIIKLIFLADKRHYLLTGRLITGSNYYSMKAGPVSSQILDILDYIGGITNKHNKCNVDTSSITLNGNDYSILKSIEYDMLSDTDKESIEFIVENFKNMSKNQLVNYTHKFPEWKKDEKIFAQNETYRKHLYNHDLLSVDEKLGITENDVSTIKEILYN